MPTVLLVDVSISLGRAVNKNHPTTRLELVQRGVLQFLQEMEEHRPYENTMLLTFSSKSQVICPFTRDYTSLKNALYSLTLQDKTNLVAGLETAKECVIKQFGFETPVQFLVITDGRPSGGNPLEVEFPFPLKLNILGFGSRQDLDIKLFEKLCKKNAGNFYFLELPQTARNFSQQFQEIVFTHYPQYFGTLALGHLTAHITLYPNPNTSNYTYIALQNDLPITFPPVISILGFVSTTLLSSPPSLCRFVLMPRPSADTSLVKMLCDSQKKKKKAALVILEPPNWYGLLHAHIEMVTENNQAKKLNKSSELTKSANTSETPEKDKEKDKEKEKGEKDKDKSKRVQKTALVLSVFPKNIVLDRIGPIHSLSTGATNENTAKIPFPELYTKSYDPSKGAYKLPLVHEEVLKSDCQKILHYVRSLPAKTEMLYAECQKLRRKGQMYCWPGLMEGLVTLLNKEVRKRKKREDSLERNILSDLITQIKDNDEDTPLQPLGISIGSPLNLTSKYNLFL